VLSRTQQYEFKMVGHARRDYLAKLMAAEGAQVASDVLMLVARKAAWPSVATVCRTWIRCSPTRRSAADRNREVLGLGSIAGAAGHFAAVLAGDLGRGDGRGWPA
jgi:hypothetical protein